MSGRPKKLSHKFTPLPWLKGSDDEINDFNQADHLPKPPGYPWRTRSIPHRAIEPLENVQNEPPTNNNTTITEESEEEREER